MNRRFRERMGLGVAAVAVAALLSACGGGSGSGNGGGDALLTINGAQPISFDPEQGQEGSWLPTFQAVYDTLLLREPDGELAPMLATSWEYDDTKTRLTLDLRGDVTFSNGEKFDAAAAKANLDHFRTGTGPQAGTLADIDTVVVDDADTLLIELKQPSPSLLFALANAGGLMGAPDALGTEEIKTQPVGSGPYELDSSASVTGSEYVFVRRDGYWNPDLQHYDKVVIKVIADPTAALNALQSGQLDAALLNSKTAVAARKNDALTEYNYVNNWLGLIIYDRDGKQIPALADPRVRQAINFAIDRDAIVESVYGGAGEVTTQIFGAESTAYVPELENAYPYDPDRARALLDEAGFGDGLTLSLPVAASLDPAMIAAVVQQLEEVGIRATTRAADPSDLIGDLTDPANPVIPITLFQPDTWTTLTSAVTPTATWNAARTTDPKVDRWTEVIRTGSEEEAETAARELNQYLVDQAWFAPIFRPSQFFFAASDVEVDAQAQQLLPSIYNYRPTR